MKTEENYQKLLEEKNTIHQVFIGRVANLLGFDVTLKILQEAADVAKIINQGKKK
jgi:hypothetical protein